MESRARSLQMETHLLSENREDTTHGRKKNTTLKKTPKANHRGLAKQPRPQTGAPAEIGQSIC